MKYLGKPTGIILVILGSMLFGHELTDSFKLLDLIVYGVFIIFGVSLLLKKN